MDIVQNPAGSKLLTDLRRDKIAELVERNGTVTSEAIAAQFDVSLMTVWRDLTSLEASHRLRRIRGGARRIERHWKRPHRCWLAIPAARKRPS